MIFAHPHTYVVEVLPIGKLKHSKQNERPCYLGLASGLGFPYYSVHSPDFHFDKRITVELNDLRRVLNLIFDEIEEKEGIIK